MSIIAITSLTKSFRAGHSTCAAEVRVLRDLDLALWPGEVVALQGASGSGKSTLLHCAAGLLRPDAGSIHWVGARVCSRECVAYAGKQMGSQPATSSSGEFGSLYSSLQSALTPRTHLVLVDDLPSAGPLETRLMLALLQRHARGGAAVLFAANAELASVSFVSRVLTLANGALHQRKNRSAARIAASSFAARARASARSTYGRSLRSPQ